MDIRIKITDTDINLLLNTILADSSNKDEMIKLLSYFICSNHTVSEELISIHLGNKLPKIIPNGSLCKLLVQNLGFDSNKTAILQSDLVDEEGYIIVKVKEFRGYHEYSEYIVEYTDIRAATATMEENRYLCQAWISAIDLIVIKDI
jgi:hypothetical protein